MPLFTPQQLTDWLQYDVTAGAAVIAEKVVAGWLRNATRLREWPDPLPDQLFSWGLELGGIAYENPTSQTNDQALNVQTSWMDRRSQILREAKAWSENPDEPAAAASTTPAGWFPPAVPLPDPAFGRLRWGSWPRG